jgi:RHS repeat-associated protein
VNDSVGGTITWVYDTVSGGHHPRVQETTTPGTVTVEYDEIGRRAKLSATGLTDTTYAYDKNSRLTGVTQGSQTVTLAYDDAGRRTSLAYPNGVVTSYGYDNANRLLTINHVKTPTTIESLTYQYDPASNRVSLNRANAAASLIPAAVSSNIYDAANEQTQFNGVTQTFDANGNLTNDGTNTYTWDARNRLTAISGGLTASFIYDGLGRRKSKTIAGTTTGFWYDGNDVLAELSVSTPTATYIRSLSIDEPFIRKLSGVDEFYEADALGSVVTLTNGVGANQTTYTYEAFGETSRAGTPSTNAFQYTRRENDGTGFYYYRARYYGPQFRRFLSVDPIEFEGGDVNLYAYVQNAPINLTDPLGFSAKCPDCVDRCLKNNYGDLADYAFKASIFGLTTVAGIEVAAYSAGAKFGVLGGLGVVSDLASQSFAKEAASILTSPAGNYSKFFGFPARAAAAASSLSVASKLAWFSSVAFTTAKALGNVGAVATVGGTSFYGTAWLYCKWGCGQTR